MKKNVLLRAMTIVLVIAGLVAMSLPAMAEDAAKASSLTPTKDGFVGITSPAAGAELSGKVEIKGTATASNLAFYKVEYSVDGAAWVSVDTDYQHKTGVSDGALATWDTATVANGEYWLRAAVVDTTGNFVASETVKVTVKNAAVATATAAPTAAATAVATAAPTTAAPAVPTGLTATKDGFVGITAPAAGATVSGKVEIKGTATATNLAFYKVEYSVDGANWVTVDTDYQHKSPVSAGTLATWDTAAFANGEYFLRAVVVDTTGNFVASDSAKVTVKNEAAAAATTAAPTTAPTATAAPVLVTTTATAAPVAAATPAPVTITGLDSIAKLLNTAMPSIVPANLATLDRNAALWYIGQALPGFDASKIPADDAAAIKMLNDALATLSYSQVGVVGITSPVEGATISGKASIKGTATSPNFQFYKVEYSVDGTNWVYIADGKSAVYDGVLATWDTTSFANGTYWLRGVVVDKTGNYVASNSVTVKVQNEAAK